MGIDTAIERRMASDFAAEWFATIIPDGTIDEYDRSHLCGNYRIPTAPVLFGISGTAKESLDGDFTLSGWYKDLSAPTLPFFVAWDIGVLDVRTIDNGGTYQLQISDGINSPILIDLSADGDSWFNIIIVRSGTSILVYEDSELVHTETGWVAVDYGDSIAAISSSLVKYFDLRVLNVALSASDIDYYYDDVINNEGEATLPRWV